MKLRTKLLLSVALPALLAGEGVILCARKAVHGELVSRIEFLGLREAGEISGSLAKPIRSADERGLLPLLHSYLQSNGGVYAMALDQQGRVLAHTNVGEVGQVYRDELTVAGLKSERTLSREIRIKDKSVLDLTVPIFDESMRAPDEDFLLAGGADDKKGARVGTLRVGLSLDETSATERHISGRILRGVLVLGAATGLILFAFMRRVLAPIGLLASATAKIGGGDYRVSVPVNSNDELGQLAASFNAMTQELGSTTISKQFFNDILDHIQDQVIVTDAAGAITLVNPAVLAALGYAEEELIGRSAATLLEGEGASFTAPTRSVGASLLAKGGAKISVLFSASAITGAAGAITGWIGAAKDVSDLKKLEARVHQSEKLSAVGQLAAGVAHEINNPLGVILGFAQAMSREMKPGDANELPITSIEREALRCKALVQNLLTFARTSHSDRVPMDLNAAVSQSLALIEPQAKMGRVKLVTRLAEKLPPVLANKGQLEQVIMNLAKNAIDAMPDGGEIELSTELLEGGPNSWVCLRVSDDGSGIPPALLSKVFDPFFTTKPIGQGTGLGLSLVNEIVQKHSGEISLESRPGRTVFSVKLPVRTGEELERRILEARAEKRDSAASAASTKGAISHG